MLAGVGIGDRRLRRIAGRVADEHRSRLGCTLDARGGVDEVAGDHALPLGGERHRRLAGEDAYAEAQVGHGGLLRQRLDRVDEIESCPHGPFGVVLPCDGRPPEGHDRVADELLHRAAVALDHRARGFEVARLQLAHVLEIAPFRQGRVPDEVGEQNAHEPALGLGRRRRRSRRRLRSKRSPALATELLTRWVLRPARRATGCESLPALTAELLALRIGGAARRTGHRTTSADGAIRSSRSSQTVDPMRSNNARASVSSSAPSSGRPDSVSQRP